MGDYIEDVGKADKRPKATYKSKGKISRSTDINDMRLGAILWFLAKRHKMLLMTTYAAVITTLYIVNGLPIAIHHLFGR